MVEKYPSVNADRVVWPVTLNLRFEKSDFGFQGETLKYGSCA
jgi:hypothetical protein